MGAWSEAEIKAKITKTKADIELLETLVSEYMETGSIGEYHLNDGQAISKVIYKSPSELATLIKTLEYRVERWYNKLSRTAVARDMDARIR